MKVRKNERDKKLEKERMKDRDDHLSSHSCLLSILTLIPSQSCEASAYKPNGSSTGRPRMYR